MMTLQAAMQACGAKLMWAWPLLRSAARVSAVTIMLGAMASGHRGTAPARRWGAPMPIIRSATFALALLTACAAFGFQAGDAICKGDPIPPGFVPVEEQHASQCAGSPNEKNAWVLEALNADGMTVCVAPDYAKDPPPNIGFAICERNFSDRCPSTFDGTANAYFIHPTCSMETAKMKCGLPPRANESDEYVSGLADRQWAISNTLEPCPTDASRPRYLYREVGKYPLPLCLRDNELIRYDGDLIKASEGKHTEDILVVVRQFFNGSCPGDDDTKTNAMVVRRYTSDEYAGQTLLHCVESDGDAGSLQFPSSPPANTWTASHDDRCGLHGSGPRLSNAFNIAFPGRNVPATTSQSDASVSTPPTAQPRTDASVSRSPNMARRSTARPNRTPARGAR